MLRLPQSLRTSLRLTGTLAICISLSAHNTQIIADHTVVSGKESATMLCKVIEDDYLSSSLKDCTSDRATKALAEYKSACEK